jgi:hypothetical protein
MMKTMFPVPVAVLGFALGTASLVPAAHLSQVHLYPPARNGQG